MNNTTNEEGMIMPFCPECNTEYKQNTLTCSKCNEDLLPSLAPAHGLESVDWIVVKSVSNEVAAHILTNVLKDEGIEVFLRSNEIPLSGGIKGNAAKSEWGDILVPTYSVTHAQECIKAYFDSLNQE